MPVPSRVGVRSMITVTKRVPRPVWRQQCSSTPITSTPSKRAGSLISNCRPAASTASLTVCQAAPRLAAIRVIDMWSMTSDFSAQSTAWRLSFARGAAACLVSCRQTRAQWAHLYRRTRMKSVVGRQPSGTCANRRTTVPVETPSAAASAPGFVFGHPAFEYRLERFEVLAGDGESELVDQAEAIGVGGGESRLGHVEVFLDGQYRSFHLGKASTFICAPPRHHVPAVATPSFAMSH
ncbi:hypothetical protein EV640_1182 [Nesterenkonia aurantiaca]|uniref:Uncharacterized protein n=1 Tax=Nesterenkonia aurantiaca TaxID=1436010 RepID=A0A4R7FUF8_9MICC|nr:hypothetical protein EV640_1182 [Nesterenkonia aurantiaca]